MAPFAVAGVVAGMALFWGAAAVVYTLLKSHGVLRVLLFAGALSACEWLRGHVLTGFPWNLAGETWRAGSPPSQPPRRSAPMVSRGLRSSFSPARPWSLKDVGDGRCWWWRRSSRGRSGSRAPSGSRRPTPTALRAPWIRIVQADVEQETKYDPELLRSIVGRYIDLTGRPSSTQSTSWCGPKGHPIAFDDYLTAHSWISGAIGWS